MGMKLRIVDVPPVRTFKTSMRTEGIFHTSNVNPYGINAPDSANKSPRLQICLIT